MDRELSENLIRAGLSDLEQVKFEDWLNDEAGVAAVGMFVRRER